MLINFKNENFCPPIASINKECWETKSKQNRLVKLPGWHITWESEAKVTSAASVNKMPLQHPPLDYNSLACQWTKVLLWELWGPAPYMTHESTPEKPPPRGCPAPVLWALQWPQEWLEPLLLWSCSSLNSLRRSPTDKRGFLWKPRFPAQKFQQLC